MKLAERYDRFGDEINERWDVDVRHGTARNWGRHRCRCLSCVYRLLLAQPRTLNGARVLVLVGGV